MDSRSVMPTKKRMVANHDPGFGKSLNTGTIFVQRLLGQETFRTYVKSLGLVKTHIPLHTK